MHFFLRWLYGEPTVSLTENFPWENTTRVLWDTVRCSHLPNSGLSKFPESDCSWTKINQLRHKSQNPLEVNQQHKLGDFKACYFNGCKVALLQTPTTNIAQQNAYDRLRPQPDALPHSCEGYILHIYIYIDPNQAKSQLT